MEGIWNVDNIKALKNLLKDPEDTDSEHEGDSMPMSKVKPSDIGPKTKTKDQSKGDVKKKEKNPDDIWDIDEIPEGTEFEDIYDPRPAPEYEIYYKQSVTTEDVFLQLGAKNPTTASCEFMVVKIKLPGTKLPEINLDVKEKYLDLRAPKYKLGLYLPNPVDPDSSKAIWHEKNDTLEVTLRNKREYDFLNE